MREKKIVCLGGGIGTMNLVKGLRQFTSELSIIVSMADDGGSAGRLRRLYTIFPPGDVISSIASSTEDEQVSKLLTYRFPGDRYGKDDELGGQKLGNLIMVAAQEITGSFQGGIELLKKIFHTHAAIYPATNELVTLSAKTTDGRTIHGEEIIDLGKYPEPHAIDTVYLTPKAPKTSKDTLTALEEADCIIAGPGDLYTNVLPVIVVPAIANFLKKTKKKKLFIINIANKPFETKGYRVHNFIDAVAKHLGTFPFDTVLVNNKMEEELPYHYTYVQLDEAAGSSLPKSTNLLATDVIDTSYPLYHDSKKLVQVIRKYL